VDIQIVPIRTSGDWRPGHKELSFRDIGSNKEIFTKEIELALQTGHIDMAVHSMKDVASWLPEGLQIAAMLARIDPRDAFIGRNVAKLEDLPKGAALGTSSVRRQAQILGVRPDLRVVPMRGNIETRLKKLAEGQADGTLLAMAGLIRLSLQERASPIDTAIMLPSAAQGAVGIEIRGDDEDMRRLAAAINVRATSICVTAERALLQTLEGSCHTPIGALAQWTDNDHIRLDAMTARPDGTSALRLDIKGEAAAAATLGVELGEKMKSLLPPGFFST
jgi:hydroxymethylbilane synthase